MSLFIRLIERFIPRLREQDLRDEVEFHIDMRADQFGEAGLNHDDATKRARQQFGDVNEVIMAMRQARMNRVTKLCTPIALLAVVGVFWIAQHRSESAELPALPPAPSIRDIDRPSGSPPPPPPGRGPTWKEYVTQANAFRALQQGPGTYSPTSR